MLRRRGRLAQGVGQQGILKGQVVGKTEAYMPLAQDHLADEGFQLNKIMQIVALQK